jgi:hypothetical protein
MLEGRKGTNSACTERTADRPDSHDKMRAWRALRCDSAMAAATCSAACQSQQQDQQAS